MTKDRKDILATKLGKSLLTEIFDELDKDEDVKEMIDLACTKAHQEHERQEHERLIKYWEDLNKD